MPQPLPGHKDIFDGLKSMIKGWQKLGMDKSVPEEFKQMKLRKKQLGDMYGWK